MRILIVEDEVNLANAITKGLQKLNPTTFEIDNAYDGRQALDLYYENNYDLVLLDLNIPYLSGHELVKEFRADNKKLPILILSALNDVDNKVKALDNGANDYLDKPFAFKELNARIKVLLRTNFIIKDSQVIIDDYQINLEQHNLIINGKSINLTNKEMQILILLANNLNIVFTEASIYDHLYIDDEMKSSTSIRVHINNIRKKANKDDIIKTIRGRGYYVGQ